MARDKLRQTGGVTGREVTVHQRSAGLCVGAISNCGEMCRGGTKGKANTANSVVVPELNKIRLY